VPARGRGSISVGTAGRAEGGETRNRTRKTGDGEAGEKSGKEARNVRREGEENIQEAYLGAVDEKSIHLVLVDLEVRHAERGISKSRVGPSREHNLRAPSAPYLGQH
jgi:hypothetical protein